MKEFLKEYDRVRDLELKEKEQQEAKFTESTGQVSDGQEEDMIKLKEENESRRFSSGAQNLHFRNNRDSQNGNQASRASSSLSHISNVQIESVDNGGAPQQLRQPPN